MRSRHICAHTRLTQPLQIVLARAAGSAAGRRTPAGTQLLPRRLQYDDVQKEVHDEQQ